MLSNLNRRRFLRSAACILVPAPFVIGQSLRNPAFVARLSGGMATQIRTGMVSFWRLEEDATATRVDALGVNDLTPSESIARKAGKTNYGVDCIAANSSLLGKSNPPTLRGGDIDFTFSCWANFDIAGTASSVNVMSKKNAAGSHEYYMGWTSVGNTLFFSVYPDGTNAVFALSSFTPQTGKWYCIIGWHDSVNNKVGIQAGETALEDAQLVDHSTGVYVGAGAFRIGSGNSTAYFDGVIDNAAFWSRCLSQAERDYVFANPELV